MSATPKLPRDVVLPTAQHLLAVLRPHCLRIELAGSLRRERPTVGDIELVAIPRPRTDLFGDPLPAPTLLDAFLAEKGVQFTKSGDRYKQFAYGRHTVDLFLTTPERWGSVFTIRTGSADFSHWLVTASPRVTFSDGRLYAHGRRLLTPEETDVFAALGLAYVDPTDRHGPLPEAPRIDPIWNFD